MTICLRQIQALNKFWLSIWSLVSFSLSCSSKSPQDSLFLFSLSVAFFLDRLFLSQVLPKRWQRQPQLPQTCMPPSGRCPWQVGISFSVIFVASLGSSLLAPIGSDVHSRTHRCEVTGQAWIVVIKTMLPRGRDCELGGRKQYPVC